MRATFVPARRPVRAIAFALMAAGGVASMMWPPAAVQAATSPVYALAYLWAALLILGGVCSAAGALTDRWLGEYVGLWPLITVFAVYGLAAFASSRGLAALAGGFVLTAVAALLLARWQDVALIRQETARTARTEDR
jgi:hypothetical protein